MLDNANCAICTLINHFFTGKFNMSLKPICVAIALTLTLTACGSSDNPSLTIPKISTTTSNATGNSSSSTTTNSSTSNAGVTVDKTYAVSALKAEVDKQLKDAYGYAGFNSTNNYQVTVGGKTYTSGNIDLKTLKRHLKIHYYFHFHQISFLMFLFHLEILFPLSSKVFVWREAIQFLRVAHKIQFRLIYFHVK